MICPSKSYPAYKPSGVSWLGDVPSHWEVRQLRTVADMRVSNVDKHTREDEVPVRLCNYVDVYKNDRITQAMPFMAATASRDEIERFRLESGDVLITKDSEAWDDIGVPALVAKSAHDLLCGYHLALLRPFTETLGSYLARTLQSKAVAYQFHVRANGVTRYGLTHTGIQSVQVPLPPLLEQAAIVRYLDHADRRIRHYVTAKRKLIALLEEERQAVVNRAALCGNVHITRGQFWASEHAVVAALDVGHEIDWFGAILTAMNLNQYSIAAAQPGLAVERILNLYLPVPHLQEQKNIANHIEGATADIVAAIVRARRQMELVQEYRTRLIADVVTGKLDVREAAAQLPDESDEEGPIDRDGLVLDNMDDGSSDVSQLLEEEQTMESEVIA